LGPAIWSWVAEHLLIPDGPRAGDPLVLTSDQVDVLYRFYAVDELGWFKYRRACWRAAQGSGKSPLMAAIALAELCGPTRFEGWSDDGLPIATRPTSPYIQVAAVSEDQSQNVYRASYLMAAESDLAGDVLSVGRMRIDLADRTGMLEPVTASAGSRLGQRLTFAIADETSLWNRKNGGHRLIETLRRNVAKMGGRSAEVTNAHVVGEDSVAERSYKSWLDGADGLLYVAREGPEVTDLTDRAAVRAALSVTYGDSALDRGGWVDLDRITADVLDPDTGADQSRRFFLNRLTSGGVTPVDVTKWEKLEKGDRIVADGERIALGFDGSISDDETVLYGCTEDRHLFLIGAWTRPEDAPPRWRVPRGEVHELLAETFERYDVAKMYADPPHWGDEISMWTDQYGGRDGEVVVALDTNSGRRFAPLVDAFVTAVEEGTLSHDGNPNLTLHLAACARKTVRLADADDDDGRIPYVIVKADTRKIDRAVAAILALGAARQVPPPAAEVSVWFV
jgi:hypothetical protein